MQTAAPALLLILALACSSPWEVQAKGFLRTNQAVEGQLGSGALDAELDLAMSAALGCGGPADAGRMEDIKKALMPLWQTLPKNAHGRIDQRSLRYAAHRFFMEQSNIQVRGFEPSRVVNSTHQGHAEILSQRVPAFVEMMLEGKHATLGFTLQDAVWMVATIQQLIHDSDRHVLEASYHHEGVALDQIMKYGSTDTRKILDGYMVRWMLGGDDESINAVLSDRSLLTSSFPHWNMISDFAYGQIEAMNFERTRAPVASRAKDTLERSYTFDDMHDAVEGITGHFASFWESECSTMKAQLVDMDSEGDGRVPLSKFYGTGLDADWRFGESEAYLRDLGALDETSSWRGKQVIIPNYIQAASNCIVSTAHYLVCCQNECEGILGDIEVAIGKPAASPEEILRVVGNVTVETGDLVERTSPNLKPNGALTKQLEQIADTYGGQVPLHGRLFAQWLHYVFPQECPFPRKSGTASMATPIEFGADYIASHTEMSTHASQIEEQDAKAKEIDQKEEDVMSQWDHEEELFADYTGHLKAPWESRPHRWVIFLLLIAVAGAAVATGGVSGLGSIGGKGSKQNDFLPMHSSSNWGMAGGRAHMV